MPPDTDPIPATVPVPFNPYDIELKPTQFDPVIHAGEVDALSKSLPFISPEKRVQILQTIIPGVDAAIMQRKSAEEIVTMVTGAIGKVMGFVVK